MQEIITGECLEVMKSYPSNHFSCVVTDSPYGISFMGKGWDKGIPSMEYWQEMLRVTKPGGHLVAAGLPRMMHRLISVIEDSGWEVRDLLMHLFGSGFPKSHNHFGIEGYGTALKPAWEGWTLCMKPLEGTFKQNAEKWGQAGINIADCRINTLPCQRLLDKISDNEVLWEQEKYLCNSCVDHVENKTKQEILEIAESFAINSVVPILIENARQFLIDLNILDIGCSGIHCQEEQREKVDENLSLNMSKYGKESMALSQKDLLSIILTTTHTTIRSRTCSLCQEQITSDIMSQNILALKKETLNMLKERVKKEKGSRWPSNAIFDEEAGALLDEQSGNSKSPSGMVKGQSRSSGIMGAPSGHHFQQGHADSGGASRFFYCAKASSSERNAGLEGMPFGEPVATGRSKPDIGRKDPKSYVRQNFHPTVKPLKLMEYLIKLVMPPQGGILLDPFAGSGSTILAAKRLGFDAVGIERVEEYSHIARKRIETAVKEKTEDEANPNQLLFDMDSSQEVS